MAESCSHQPARRGIAGRNAATARIKRIQGIRLSFSSSPIFNVETSRPVRSDDSGRAPRERTIMVDMRIFNSLDVTPISRYEIMTENDPAYPITKLLDTNMLFIYYSPAPAETLLTAVDRSMPAVNLSDSRHAFGGIMVMHRGPMEIWWMLFEGRYGSALVFLSSDGQYASSTYELVGANVGKVCDGITECVTRFAFAADGECLEGAAAAIGAGDIVAPWAVPGYERTAMPDAENNENGWHTRVYPAQLRRAFHSWERLDSAYFIKRDTEYLGKPYSVISANYLTGIGGPALVFAINDIPWDELTTTFRGDGNLHPHMFEGQTPAVCALIHPDATDLQLDAAARDLAAAVLSRLADDGSDPSHADAAASNTATTSSPGSSTYSTALLNAVASMLDRSGFTTQIDRENGRIYFPADIDSSHLINAVFIRNDGFRTFSRPYIVFDGNPRNTKQVDVRDPAQVRRVQEFFSRSDFAQVRWSGMFELDLDDGTVDVTNSLYCGDAIPPADVIKNTLYEPILKWTRFLAPFIDVLQGTTTPEDAAKRGRSALMG